jgi:hypothetical protein
MKRLLSGLACGLLILTSAAGFVPSDLPVAENHSTNQQGIVKSISELAGRVSEPTTLSLLGAGLIGAAWVARKRRHKVSPQS